MKDKRSSIMSKIPGILLIIIIILGVVEKDNLYKAYYSFVLNQKMKTLTTPSTNEYFRQNNYNYVQATENFVPKNRQDLLNILYTVIASGDTEYTFYCPVEYLNCISDLNSIAEDQTILSDINNFVHPYNSFKHIETKYDNTGEVDIVYTKNYTQSDIDVVNQRIDYLFSRLYRQNDTQYNNIKRFHDYVANHSVYDTNRADNDIIKYKSDIAYGPLLEGYGLCGGYSDAMAIYLDKMNIPNFKVASREHVWNAIKLNNKWYHLDITWDDPLTDTGENYLIHDFFMIDTKTLDSKHDKNHNYSKKVYSELQ